MSTKRHTKESIIQTLQNVAAQLGQTVLSKRDVGAHVSLSAIAYHFGKLSRALEAAGLAGNKPGLPAAMRGLRLTNDDLFGSLLSIEQQIGHAPTFSEFRANGGTLSDRPFRKRFGNWDSALQHYNNWKADCGCAPTVVNGPSSDPANVDGHLAPAATQAPATQSPIPVLQRPRKAPQLFGEPIDFRGLRHAPINEQGVVYLFGMVSRELGFSVEALQQGFPD